MTTNVDNWFRLDRSRKLEEQVKWYISFTVEGYINGSYGGYEGYDPMTLEEWYRYIKWSLDYDIDEGQSVNGVEFRHLRLIGNDRLRELVETFIKNYSDVQKFVKE